MFILHSLEGEKATTTTTTTTATTEEEKKKTASKNALFCIVIQPHQNTENVLRNIFTLTAGQKMKADEIETTITLLYNQKQREREKEKTKIVCTHVKWTGIGRK